jgi:cell division protein FtsB
MGTPNATPVAAPPPADRRGRRLRPFWLVAGALLLALGLVAGFERWRDLRVVEQREAELEEEIAATRGEIDRIQRRLQRIAEDPDALERLARDELAMVYPDEVVVLLPAAAAPEAAAPPPPPPPRAATPEAGGPTP